MEFTGVGIRSSVWGLQLLGLVQDTCFANAKQDAESI